MQRRVDFFSILICVSIFVVLYFGVIFSVKKNGSNKKMVFYAKFKNLVRQEIRN